MEGLGSIPHEETHVPIYALRRHRARPEVIGTGVHFRLGNESFLLTAAHVVTELHGAHLCLPMIGGIRPVTAHFGSVSGGSLPAEAAATLDVATIRIVDDQGSSLESYYRPIAREYVDVSGSLVPGERCAVLGYPATRAKHSPRGLYSELHSYVGIAATQDTYAKLGFDERISLIVEYRLKLASYPGIPVKSYRPPVPKGASGGGIFRVSSQVSTSGVIERRDLVATMHSFKGHSNYFVGTKIALQLQLLAKRYPAEVDAFLNG